MKKCRIVSERLGDKNLQKIFKAVNKNSLKLIKYYICSFSDLFVKAIKPRSMTPTPIFLPFPAALHQYQQQRLLNCHMTILIDKIFT
jgi:hypothetical protein